jgi:hypothetical protein
VRGSARALGRALVMAAALLSSARAAYRLKAAFLYNFALFTEWPAEVGNTLNLCVYGPDPFGKELDALRGRAVGARSIAIQRKVTTDALADCQIVYIAPLAIGALPRVLDSVRGRPVLTVADSLGAARSGAALNLHVDENRVSFEANQLSARAAGLSLSSKLLRLATEVIQ